MLGAVLLVVAALGAAQPPPSSAPTTGETSTPPVSVDRIRAALERPAALRLPADAPKPDFVVHIVEKSWFERVTPPLDFRAGPTPPGGLYGYEQQQRLNPNMPIPLVSVPLLPLARGLARAFSGARQSQSVSSAHGEVVRAIAEYCAAQPNGGTAIAFCMDPTMIR